MLSLLLVAKSPLQLLYAMVQLWTQELHPPLLIPVKGAGRPALTDTWGAARSGGRSHEGVDIFAPCGRPVVSATEGIVWSVGENDLGGKVVWVLGPGGSWHYYAHLSRFAEIGRGDHVQRGVTLGYVGKTGNAAGTSCHLHYGIYRKGKAENPYPFLAPRQLQGAVQRGGRNCLALNGAEGGREAAKGERALLSSAGTAARRTARRA